MCCSCSALNGDDNSETILVFFFGVLVLHDVCCMGAAISAMRDFLSGPDQKAKEDVLQQLMFLVTTANTKLDLYQAEMER